MFILFANDPNPLSYPASAFPSAHTPSPSPSLPSPSPLHPPLPRHTHPTQLSGPSPSPPCLPLHPSDVRRRSSELGLLVYRRHLFSSSRGFALHGSLYVGSA